jgi:hypothetical protein
VSQNTNKQKRVKNILRYREYAPNLLNSLHLLHGQVLSSFKENKKIEMSTLTTSVGLAIALETLPGTK